MNKPTAPIEFNRPRTRGELCELLKSGVSCEVASHVSEMTETLLRGWLDFSEFKVRPSKNCGWVVFEVYK